MTDAGPSVTTCCPASPPWAHGPGCTWSTSPEAAAPASPSHELRVPEFADALEEPVAKLMMPILVIRGRDDVISTPE